MEDQRDVCSQASIQCIIFSHSTCIMVSLAGSLSAVCVLMVYYDTKLNMIILFVIVYDDVQDTGSM